MNGEKTKCPSHETIMNYLNMELNETEAIEVEEHFSYCDECISQFNYYKEYIEQISLSASVQKELWHNSDVDFVSVSVANASQVREVSELVTDKDKYTIRLIPYQDEISRALLVIEVADQNINGDIKVFLLDNANLTHVGTEPLNEEHQACFEVPSSINLKNLILKVENK
jgi:hypothetical protein